ncbi:hypothetical protein J4210_04275 [Candidatus Woesearchaeota archaeon]|nr:hypothetical protein [Candidatus Woesearchaeota archaeon]
MKTTTLTLGLDDEERPRGYRKEVKREASEKPIEKEAVTFGRICGIASVLSASYFPGGSFIVGLTGLIYSKHETTANILNVIGLILAVVMFVFG